MAAVFSNLAEAREFAAEAQKSNARLEQKMSVSKKRTETVAGNLFELGEVGGSAFAFGFANGKWGEDGEIKILGHLPADLMVAGLLGGAGLFGGLGKYREHGINIAAGALASFAVRSGLEFGRASASDDDDDDDDDTASAKNAPAKKTAVRMNGRAASVGWDGQTYTVHEEAA
jgi:hypothetical protein